MLVHHAAAVVGSVRRAPGLSTPVEDELGVIGVAVFFSISGFLMARLVRETEPWTFLAHRVARIFSGYLAVVALVAALFGALGIAVSLNPLALSLAPTGFRTYPLNVEWTLLFETSFYIGLFLLALARRRDWLVPGTLVWLGALAVSWAALPTAYRGATLPPAYILPVSAACVAFAGGLLLPALIARRLCPPVLALLAPVLFAATAFVEPESKRWAAGIGSTLLVGAAVQVGQVSRSGVVGRVLVGFGDWSYALYLLHVPAILVVLRLTPEGWPPRRVAGLAVAAALLAAALVGPVEAEGYRRLRRRLNAASIPRLRALGLAYLALFCTASLYGSVETKREAWRRSGAEAALARLPAEALRTREGAAAAIASAGIAAPATLLAGYDGIEPLFGADLLLGAWAVDTARPDAVFHLAAFCGGRLAAIDQARRRRPDVAAALGAPALAGRRIGFRLRVPGAACGPDGPGGPGSTLVAIAVAPDGRLAVLPAEAGLRAGSGRP